MPGPLFRVTLITLITAGIGGGLLYTLQAQPKPAGLASSDPGSNAPRALHARYHPPGPDDGYAALFAGIGPTAFTSNPRPSPAQPAPAPSSADDPVVPLPLAREALASVGIDDLAEAIWEIAINDPALAPEDRQDLIEDLNQDGFADPDHPAQSELPLIEARLALITRLAPEAIDQTNADAFAEAKKDLEQMRAQLSGASGMAPPAHVPGASGAPPEPDSPKPTTP